MTADAAVREHLMGVVRTLRAERGPGRPRERARMLDVLEAYARAGRFPRHDRPVAPRARTSVPPRAFHAPEPRTPRFRDDHGTWCAVGHLVAATDPALADSIARRFDDRWLAEIDEPALIAWADRHGLRPAELEWIQPSYFCDHLEHCADVELVAPAPAIETCPTGPDPAIHPDLPATRCAECDGRMNVWVWVQNRGGHPAHDVKAELLWHENVGRPDPEWDSGVAEGLPVDNAPGITIEPGEIVAMGPLVAPEFWQAAGMRITAAEDCSTPNNSLYMWDWGSMNGGGWRLPEECPSATPCPGDAADPPPISCGCDPVPGAWAPVGVGIAALAAVVGKRRRNG